MSESLRLLTKNERMSKLFIFSGLGKRSFQKNTMFLCSFAFFIKERFVLCVLLHSLQKNAVFFAFFYILCKRTRRSLPSFTFFIKERRRTLCSFWFHKSYKNDQISQKTVHSFLRLKKNLMFFFAIYASIYISLCIFIYLYIYIYLYIFIYIY